MEALNNYRTEVHPGPSSYFNFIKLPSHPESQPPTFMNYSARLRPGHNSGGKNSCIGCRACSVLVARSTSLLYFRLKNFSLAAIESTDPPNGGVHQPRGSSFSSTDEASRPTNAQWYHPYPKYQTSSCLLFHSHQFPCINYNLKNVETLIL